MMSISLLVLKFSWNQMFLIFFEDNLTMMALAALQP